MVGVASRATSTIIQAFALLAFCLLANPLAKGPNEGLVNLAAHGWVANRLSFRPGGPSPRLILVPPTHPHTHGHTHTHTHTHTLTHTYQQIKAPNRPATQPSGKSLIGWSFGCLVVWLVAWLVGWLVGRPICWYVGVPVCRYGGMLVCRCIGWVIGWLIACGLACLLGQLAVWLVRCVFACMDCLAHFVSLLGLASLSPNSSDPDVEGTREQDGY